MWTLILYIVIFSVGVLVGGRYPSVHNFVSEYAGKLYSFFRNLLQKKADKPLD